MFTENRASFASSDCRRYHGSLMSSVPRSLCLIVLSLLLLASGSFLWAGDSPALFPLSDVKPGMKGVAYTIFSGDEIEPINLVVIGVLHNALGPKQDVILVQLLGDKAETTGVAAGMSGSPVYFDGKLAGALALKLGMFTKDAIGGVTPIQEMLEVENLPASPPTPQQASPASEEPNAAAAQVPLPDEFARHIAAGAGQFLVPIETPLISTGLYPETLAQFGKNLSAWGMTAMAGGAAPGSPDDANIKPGDMVGMDLVRGDLSLSAGCTVTAIEGDHFWACGHPLFGFGKVALPLSRAHVLLTLASSMESTKIMSTGGTIGTLTQDRRTAVMGTFGPGPSMIPLDVTLETLAGVKEFHFEMIESPQLTPLLVAVAAYNGIVGSPAYGEGSTLQMDAAVDVKGHTPVKIENLFAPTDQPIPAGMYVALSIQSAFERIYSNPYEVPEVQRISLHVKELPNRRWAMIDQAWAEKTEVRPGETVSVKVMLRPYRGAPFLQEIPVTIPIQATPGRLQLVVSDAQFLNRNVQSLEASSEAQLPGLEELINLVNRERPNDRLYATLLQPAPTILVDDKELPNVPVSEINILDQRQNPGGARLLWQSTVGEWSVEMHQVITGQHVLAITVK